MSKSQKRLYEVKKPYSKVYIFCDSIYMAFYKMQNCRDIKSTVGNGLG